MSEREDWTTIIKPQTGWFEFDFKEIKQYKDLIFMLVKRSFVAQYKQTILGPLWFVLNPLLTTFVSTIVFGNIAGIQTDGIPYFLFHLCGSILWGYFSTCVSQTSATFTANASILGKVYFPRVIMPISTVLFSAINMIIVFGMTVIAIIVYALSGVQFNIRIGIHILMIPLLMLQTALLSLGIGVIVSSLTTKYRDLTVLVSFGLQLWMYATPIVYPVSALQGKIRTLIMLNPMTPIISNFRYVMLGVGRFEVFYWLISIGVTIAIALIGLILFNRVEKTFMDTI